MFMYVYTRHVTRRLNQYAPTQSSNPTLEMSTRHVESVSPETQGSYFGTATTASLQRLAAERLHQLEAVQETIEFIHAAKGTERSLEETLATARAETRQYRDQCTKLAALVEIRRKELDKRVEEVALTAREAAAAEEYVSTLQADVNSLRSALSTKGLPLPDLSKEAEERAFSSRAAQLRAEQDVVSSLEADAEALSNEVRDLQRSVDSLRSQVRQEQEEEKALKRAVSAAEDETRVNMEVLEELRGKLATFKGRRAASRTSSVSSTPSQPTATPMPASSIESVLADIEALSQALDASAAFGPRWHPSGSNQHTPPPNTNLAPL